MRDDGMGMTVGLAGCGAWGRNILRDLLALGVRVHVADTSPDARAAALERGAATVCALADGCPECDGYVVAVPIPDLAPVCAGLLARRKPVFAEKTLCLTMEAADDLSARGGDQLLFAMHKWHYHPGIEALRRLARSGRIGTLREIFCFRHGWVTDFHGGDVFWTLAVHDLTIVEHILGGLPDRIRHVHTIRDAGGTPVSLTAAMEGMGVVANLSVNARHAVKISRVSVHGTEGTALLEDAYKDHIRIRNQEGEECVPIDTTFPLQLELREFVEHLRGGPRPRCDLKNARDVTRLLLALRERAGIS